MQFVVAALVAAGLSLLPGQEAVYRPPQDVSPRVETVAQVIKYSGQWIFSPEYRKTGFNTDPGATIQLLENSQITYCAWEFCKTVRVYMKGDLYTFTVPGMLFDAYYEFWSGDGIIEGRFWLAEKDSGGRPAGMIRMKSI